MTAKPYFASVPLAGAEAGDAAAPTASAGPFVLNLCSSSTPMSTPMALTQTDLLTFFVSRRFEEGRELFRLHMGYFATLAEAEEWLGILREIYPGAWAGEAPGSKLPERADAAAPAPAAARLSGAPPAGAGPRPPVPLSGQAFVRTAAPAQPPATPSAQPNRGVVPASAHTLQPPSNRTVPPTALRARPAVKPVFEDSNLREVLEALGNASATGENRLLQAPPPPPAREASAEAGSLSDTQVLRLLEARRPEGSGPLPAESGHCGIPLLTPDDTATRRALKDAVSSNAPVSFAVQLLWSVQPVKLDKVRSLEIFNAYTLYTVEGSRDGCKWYGLRLGFFSNAIYAKQVAHYVRSEFTSVAVVPVSPQEKARATDQDVGATLAAPVPARPITSIHDDGAARALKQSAQAPASAKPPMKGAADARVAMSRALLQAAQPRGRPCGGGKVGARDRRGPQTLETLGASQLSIDSSGGETLNESGVRHPRVEMQKNSLFSKLLERLSERLKRP
jgi:hypothetical protein